VDGSVGTTLQEARRRRKLSLEKVEATTKIRLRYLQAIEEEDWEQLPGDTYARAFIRTYGDLLGLDGGRLAEEQRRARGSPWPGEDLPGMGPPPRRRLSRKPGPPRFSPRLVAFLVSALVVAALLVIGLSTGGESGEEGAGPGPRLSEAKAVAPPGGQDQGQQGTRGHLLQLQATGEVWVCLLGGRDEPLIDGRTLNPGDTEGPFRSGSFTLALGNGAVTMTVDGQQAKLLETASPIGYAVDNQGAVHELPEGERPTCT
jgi:cytoskeleton protein RodZ